MKTQTVKKTTQRRQEVKKSPAKTIKKEAPGINIKKTQTGNVYLGKKKLEGSDKRKAEKILDQGNKLLRKVSK